MINKPAAIFTHHPRKVYPQVWHTVLSLPFNFFFILKEFITQRISHYETSQGRVCSMPAATHLTNTMRKNVSTDSNIHSIALQQHFPFLVTEYYLPLVTKNNSLLSKKGRQLSSHVTDTVKERTHVIMLFGHISMPYQFQTYCILYSPIYVLYFLFYLYLLI